MIIMITKVTREYYDLSAKSNSCEKNITFSLNRKYSIADSERLLTLSVPEEADFSEEVDSKYSRPQNTPNRLRISSTF